VAKDRKPAPFPSEDDVLAFIRDTKGKVTKREIARAFHIKGQEKILLKKLLRSMINGGVIAQDNHKSLRPADRLPPVQVVEYAGTDDGGDPLVRIVSKLTDSEIDTVIYLSNIRSQKQGKAMGRGDRALARIIPISEDPKTYRAEVIKHLENAPTTLMGVFNGNENGGNVTPVDKKNRNEFVIAKDDLNGVVNGELVLIEPVTKGKRQKVMGLKNARVKERLGDVSSAKSVSLIAIHAHDIPIEFPNEALEQAENAVPVEIGKRVDYRDIPLITIDPSDARDHDDAIYAEADTDASNKGGWHVIVAIADVAHFVRSGSALDKEARKRGNSCYFPDRVVPMLPEALSAGLCSLRPGEERACMAVHMWFDADGEKLRHKFERGLMKSAANISYERVQAALDGIGADEDNELLEPVLIPLHAAWKAIMIAREKRGPLDLDMPERKIMLTADGKVDNIVLRDRFDAHRIVEEMMINANVCAAETLENHNVLPMYRLHDVPGMDKIESLREFLGTLDISLPKGQVLRPASFNGILAQAKKSQHEAMINQVVLRSQMQAIYSTENRGHFGLALTHYAHFTSPIRRYADLLVHRGLIRAIKAGDDGLSPEETDEMPDLAEHISNTERRAMAAERDSTDRYLASYLSGHMGEEFMGRITGVTRFGLFVSLEPSGGDGLIPMATLESDYFVYDEANHALVGERTKIKYQLGQRVKVRLEEANQITGGLRLHLLDQPESKGRGGKKYGKSKNHRKGGKPSGLKSGGGRGRRGRR